MEKTENKEKRKPAKKEKKKISETIEIPKGIEVKIENYFVMAKGPKGENKKHLFNKKIQMKVEDKKIMITSKRSTKREKKAIGTFRAHIKNMLKGVTDTHKYVLKICSGHFPMNVSVSNNQIIVKNLLGEKIPRVMDIKEGINVKVENDQIIVESVDKEKASQCAASIEKLTRRTGYDSRIFQDGCWITAKDGKEIK